MTDNKNKDNDYFGSKFSSSNYLIITAMFVVVIHGFATKLWNWLNKGKAKEAESGSLHPLDQNKEEFIVYNPPRYSEKEMIQRSKDFYDNMNVRRSTRFFSEEDVPMEVIENIVHTAGTAPSGAHTEPWSFVVVRNQQVKEKIREIVEQEEKINYERRMGKVWLKDLEKLNTSWQKPYLSHVPYVIAVFKHTYSLSEAGGHLTTYYNELSVSIACGLLLAAIQNAGLVTLTSTPMNAGPKLRKLLNRGANEKNVLLLPVGYPSEECFVPNLTRKPLKDILFTV